MSIICLHCKINGNGRLRKGMASSRVVESRRVIARTRLRGRREVTRTIQRIRQCKKCRYRWKTIEVTVVRRG